MCRSNLLHWCSVVIICWDDTTWKTKLVVAHQESPSSLFLLCCEQWHSSIVLYKRRDQFGDPNTQSHSPPLWVCSKLIGTDPGLCLHLGSIYKETMSDTPLAYLISNLNSVWVITITIANDFVDGIHSFISNCCLISALSMLYTCCVYVIAQLTYLSPLCVWQVLVHWSRSALHMALPTFCHFCIICDVASVHCGNLFSICHSKLYDTELQCVSFTCGAFYSSYWLSSHVDRCKGCLIPMISMRHSDQSQVLFVKP